MVSTPTATPVTVPDASIVAIALLLLVQKPEVTVSPSVTVAPWQTVTGPVITPAEGGLLTTKATSAEVLPQILVTV